MLHKCDTSLSLGKLQVGLDGRDLSSCHINTTCIESATNTSSDSFLRRQVLLMQQVLAYIEH